MILSKNSILQSINSLSGITIKEIIEEKIFTKLLCVFLVVVK